MFEQGRPLSVAEHQQFQPYFKSHLLQKVRLIVGCTPFWLSRSMVAVVLGHRIYFREGAYQFNTLQGAELLAHELAHVEQYLTGMTIFKYLWAARQGYRQNPYEVEAYAKGVEVRKQMQLIKSAPSK